MQTHTTGASASSSLSSIFQRQARTSAHPAATSASASTAATADQVTISREARDLLAAQSNSAAPPAGNGDTAVFETSKGRMTLNIDDYFSPHANVGGGLDSLPPLLLPNPKNIDALNKHISAAFPQFLERNGIPYAPSTISYDTEGKVQLPADYPYAAEFKQALEKEPTMARELSTVSALTSHLVEMRKAAPFHEEYAAASSQAEADAVVAKYSHLFWGNRHNSAIALCFSATGELSLTADGEPVSVRA